jgi:branched-chain amino acid transport system substrate-binding protein
MQDCSICLTNNLIGSHISQPAAKPDQKRGKTAMRLAFATGLFCACLHSTSAAELPMFKVGVLTDLSGLYSDVSGPGSIEAARLAVADFNPEAHGFRVEIIPGDHLNKPDVGSNLTQRWLSEDGVDVIADVPTSSVALAVSTIVQQHNKVFLIASAGTSDLTGKACTPNNVHWTYDTWALANGTAQAVIKQGFKSWYFLTADYAFGQALERDASEVVKANGGEVIGHALAPFPTTDFSSYLIAAQASKAQVVALANSGGDTVNAVKQASEFGLRTSGKTLVSLLAFISDIHAIGLQAAQGLTLTSAFYWDLNDGTRAWTKRFIEHTGSRYPTMDQAGVYASILDWMKAVDAMDKTEARDGAAVVARMKQMPTDDPLFGHGLIRQDGRTIHDMYLFRVKAPAESHGPYDYYSLVTTIPGAQAFRPMATGGCPMVSH